jgi:large subunit ribosomal protein L10
MVGRAGLQSRHAPSKTAGGAPGHPNRELNVPQGTGGSKPAQMAVPTEGHCSSGSLVKPLSRFRKARSLQPDAPAPLVTRAWRNDKATVVQDVGKHIAGAQTLALAEYRGLTVEHLNALRRQARDKGVYLHVLKNTLARRAVAGTTFEVAQGAMVGPLIYSFSKDAVAAAKVIADFAKGNDKLVVKGGVYAGKALDAQGVKALAAIPSREVLIAQIAGMLRSPIQRLAGVLAALAEKKGAAA